MLKRSVIITIVFSLNTCAFFKKKTPEEVRQKEELSQLIKELSPMSCEHFEGVNIKLCINKEVKCYAYTGSRQGGLHCFMRK